MKLSKLNKEQLLKVAKTAVYVGVSASLDYLVHMTTGTQFGPLTPVFNIALVTLRQLMKDK